MDLQFNKTAWDCLLPVVSQIRSEEQTQEVRLPDAMPDIGRVLAAWGQVLIRGKEWRSGAMAVSGGVMAWVLYAPEDGSTPQSVEAWLPFQLKWDLPQTERDGIIQVACQLRSIDARSVSARKLMLRSAVSALGQAYEPGQVDVYTPGEVPEDVQLLKRSYPVRIPREAGEKQFQLDEELQLPASAGTVRKLIRYHIQPELIDQKLMADKVVFRGTALLHMLYQDEENTLRTWDFEIPFSQFAELEREYDQDGQAQVILAMTGLELETLEPGKLHLKASAVGQYTVSDRPMLEIVEDAYSNRRTVQPQYQQLELPIQLDVFHQTLRLEETEELDAREIVDTAFLAGQPALDREENALELEQEGAFQLLYFDAEGLLRGQVVRAEEDTSIQADANSRVTVYSIPSGREQAVLSPGQVSLRGDVQLTAVTTAEQGIPMIVALELGELQEPDPSRPSLILRRAGNDALWDVAKAAGSTVDAICRANGLSGEPDEDQMLLIPVS